MRRLRSPIVIVILMLIILSAGVAAFAQSEEDYYVEINPSIRKIPIATPMFVTSRNNAAEREAAGNANAVLIETLRFTGMFQILDPRSYLVDSNHLDPTGVSMNFRNWTQIGAELMVTGKIRIEGDLVELELRLFDTVRGVLLTGKRYRGWADDIRRMVRRFSNEIIYSLTGNWGIFDSRIAFISNGTGNKELYICDYDGSNVKRFTHDDSIALTPSWSSDGKWLAYTSFKRGKADIYIRHVQENRGYVVSEKGMNTTPEWAPGKFMLAATLSFTGDQEIYLLTGAGKIIKSLVKKWGIDISPTWSPDGSRLAFVSNRSGTPQIHILDIDSGRVERITFRGRYNTQPSWSPRGDKIAYSSMANGQINICVVDVNTKRVNQLTQNKGKNESPTWSPDGSMIAFSSTREGGKPKIFIMTAYGSEQRRLLTLPGEQTNPKWSPRMVGN